MLCSKIRRVVVHPAFPECLGDQILDRFAIAGVNQSVFSIAEGKAYNFLALVADFFTATGSGNLCITIRR